MAGIPSKEFCMGTSISTWRNSDAPWETGNTFITVCTDAGKVPMGRYIPVKNPIRVPRIVLAVLNAL